MAYYFDVILYRCFASKFSIRRNEENIQVFSMKDLF